MRRFIWRRSLLLSICIVLVVSAAYMFRQYHTMLVRNFGFFIENLVLLSVDPQKPFGLNDGLVLNLWSNFITLLLEVMATFFIINYVFERRERNRVSKTKKWIAA